MHTSSSRDNVCTVVCVRAEQIVVVSRQLTIVTSHLLKSHRDSITTYQVLQLLPVVAVLVPTGQAQCLHRCTYVVLVTVSGVASATHTSSVNITMPTAQPLGSPRD